MSRYPKSAYAATYVAKVPSIPRREPLAAFVELPLAPCCAGIFPHLPDVLPAFGVGAEAPERSVGRTGIRTVGRRSS